MSVHLFRKHNIWMFREIYVLANLFNKHQDLYIQVFLSPCVFEKDNAGVSVTL